MSPIRTRTAVAVATAAIAALTLAACGDDTGTTAGTGTSSSAAATSSTQVRSDFNDADVTFLQMMYPHHAQAVDMAKLVPDRSRNQQLLALATAVEQAQAPEMRQMTDLLRSFGKAAPSTNQSMPGMTSMPGMSGMPGMHDMPGPHGGQGMMSDEQMAGLRAASGVDFDRRWLTMMIEHHTGAIAMSETELAEGKNPDTQTMARAIVANQQAEIERMRTMLGQL